MSDKHKDEIQGLSDRRTKIRESDQQQPALTKIVIFRNLAGGNPWIGAPLGPPGGQESLLPSINSPWGGAAAHAELSEVIYSSPQ